MLTNEATKIAVESGKLLIIFNINEVHQLNPNATHVTNNYYGEEFVPDDGLQKPTFHATRNPQLSKDSVLEYVMRLHPSHVCKEWRDKYRPLWVDIIELPAVADKIFDKGKQQNTSFNRNLVGNILHKNPDPDLYPCYKVVNASGRLAPCFAFGGQDVQKMLLENDGIEVKDDFTVDIKKYIWQN